MSRHLLALPCLLCLLLVAQASYGGGHGGGRRHPPRHHDGYGYGTRGRDVRYRGGGYGSPTGGHGRDYGRPHNAGYNTGGYGSPLAGHRVNYARPHNDVYGAGGYGLPPPTHCRAPCHPSYGLPGAQGCTCPGTEAPQTTAVTQDLSTSTHNSRTTTSTTGTSTTTTSTQETTTTHYVGPETTTAPPMAVDDVTIAFFSAMPPGNATFRRKREGADSSLPDDAILMNTLVDAWSDALSAGRLTVTFLPYTDTAWPPVIRTTVKDAKDYISNTYAGLTALPAGKDPSQEAGAKAYQSTAATQAKKSGFLMISAPLNAYSSRQKMLDDMEAAGNIIKAISTLANQLATVLVGSNLTAEDMEGYGDVGSSVSTVPQARLHPTEIANMFRTETPPTMSVTPELPTTTHTPPTTAAPATTTSSLMPPTTTACSAFRRANCGFMREAQQGGGFWGNCSVISNATIDAMYADCIPRICSVESDNNTAKCVLFGEFAIACINAGAGLGDWRSAYSCPAPETTASPPTSGAFLMGLRGDPFGMRKRAAGFDVEEETDAHLEHTELSGVGEKG